MRNRYFRKKFSKINTADNRYSLVLSAVHMVYRLVNSTYGFKDLLIRLTRLVKQIIDADIVQVFMLSTDKTKFELIATIEANVSKVIEKKKTPRVEKEKRDVALGASIFTKNCIGIPLVADDNIGAIFIYRQKKRKAFTEFDREILSVVAEQTTIAIKNIQLYEQQQEIILGSIKSIGKLLKKQAPTSTHAPVYFKIVKCLAERLGMGEAQIQCLQFASLLHDAGSIDVPFEILSKTSRLTSEEFKIIKDIPAKSVELIKPVAFLKPVLPIILYHHEKYDGTGYPSGLKKEQIPLGARVMAVVTAFEAMVRPRPYKDILTITEALNELKKNSGTQFDPRVVNVFILLANQKKFRKYLRSLNS